MSRWSTSEAGLRIDMGALACVLMMVAAMGPRHLDRADRWSAVSYVDGIEAAVPFRDRPSCEAAAAQDGSVCVFGSADGR